MSGYDGDTLYSIVTGDQDLKFKEQTLSDFKAHVKRDFVDLSYVTEYFETLIIATGIPDPEVSAIAFSTICHLVKRVSIQDASVLKYCYQNVIPCLIDKLSDYKISVKSASKKALQVYWTYCPNEVDSIIKQYGLKNSQIPTRESCLQFLISIVEQQYQSFMFKPYTSTIVSFLKDQVQISTQQKAKSLLIKFFKNCSSKNAKLDLISEFIKQNIDKTTVHTLLMDIDPTLISEFNHSVYATPQTLSDEENLKFISSGSVKVTTSNATQHTLNRAKSSQTLRARTNYEKASYDDPQYDQIMSDSSIHSTTSTSFGAKNPKLDRFLSKIPGCQLETMKGIRINNVSDLRQNVEELLPAFSGKETEFNWTLREKNIIYMRSLIRGNSPIDFPDELSQCLRTFCEPITKAVSSLRTSLSSNGCQLVKEMAIFMGNHLDNVTIDVCAITLLKLSSSAKKIASQNAMSAFSSLIANISYHYRVFNQIVAAAQDKNVQPRLYSSSWIQIYILRNHGVLETANNGLSLDQLGKAIIKCLSDPNANVRESMRSTFWCFYQYWPSVGDNFLSKLDLTTKKALDRSKPLDIAASDSTIPKSPRKRQSIRELIVAKNRSATPAAPAISNKSKNVPSRPPSSGGVQGELGKPSRVGIAQKARRVSSFKTSSLAAAGVANRSKSEEIRPPSRTENESTKDIFMRAPVNNSAADPGFGVLPTNSPILNDNTFSEKKPFVQEEDMIIKLLRSDSSEMRSEGISLLKYAFLTREEIPSEVDGLLDSLSINDPNLLKPLYDIDLLPQSLKHISTENFLRSFIISHIDTDNEFEVVINDELITALVDSLSVDTLFITCAQLINTSNNVPLIMNGKLTMQFIKYKRHIFKFLNVLLLKTLENFPISDNSYTKASDTLFASIDFFKTSDNEAEVSSYIKVIKLLFEIKPQLFKRCLLSHGESVTDVVSSLASINVAGTALQPIDETDIGVDDMMDGVQMSSAYEMTMIQATGATPSLPLGTMESNANDMTMIMPNFNKTNNAKQFSSSIKENIVEENEEEDSIFHHHGLNFQKAEKEEIQETPVSDNDHDDSNDNGDIEMGETKVDGLTNFSKQQDVTGHHQPTDATTIVISTETNGDQFDNCDSDSPSSSHELITQIKNVNISSPPVAATNGSDIETIITKSDPFTTLSGEKSIKIYEDEEDSADEVILLSPSSPSNTDIDTWYAFQLQKYSNVKLNAPVARSFVETLKSRCLTEKCIEDDWLLFMIIILQSSSLIVEVNETIAFLDRVQLDSDECIYGLSILVHDLKRDLNISRDQIDSVWNLLIIKFSSRCQYYANEMWFAVLDVIQELVYRDSQLALEKVTESFIDSSQILMAFVTIKIIIKGDFYSLSADDIRHISNFCSRHANDKDVAVRKSVISIFSILSQIDDKNKYLVYDESVKGLTMARYKLIEEYAMPN